MTKLRSTLFLPDDLCNPSAVYKYGLMTREVERPFEGFTDPIFFIEVVGTAEQFAAALSDDPDTFSNQIYEDFKP